MIWPWIEAVLSDILQLMVLVGGAGGVMYWFDRWRQRPRAVIRRFQEEIDDHSDKWTIEIEIENLGGAPNSILPHARLTYVDFHGDKGEARLRVEDGADRSLSPFKPVTVRLTATEAGALIGFSWYRELTLPLSRGWPLRGRMRNGGDQQGMNAPRFWLSRLVHRLQLRFRHWELQRRQRLGVPE